MGRVRERRCLQNTCGGDFEGGGGGVNDYVNGELDFVSGDFDPECGDQFSAGLLLWDGGCSMYP